MSDMSKPAHTTLRPFIAVLCLSTLAPNAEDGFSQIPSSPAGLKWYLLTVWIGRFTWELGIFIGPAIDLKMLG